MLVNWRNVCLLLAPLCASAWPVAAPTCPAYYEKYEGCVLNTTIDKYFYVFLNVNRDDQIQITSSDYRTFYRHDGSGPAHCGRAISLCPGRCSTISRSRAALPCSWLPRSHPAPAWGSSSAVAVAVIKGRGHGTRPASQPPGDRRSGLPHRDRQDADAHRPPGPVRRRVWRTEFHHLQARRDHRRAVADGAGAVGAPGAAPDALFHRLLAQFVLDPGRTEPGQQPRRRHGHSGATSRQRKWPWRCASAWRTAISASWAKDAAPQLGGKEKVLRQGQQSAD